MKIAFCVFVVLCLINVGMVSSLLSPKSCAEFAIAPMQDFVKDRYLGAWYIHQLYDFTASHGHNCYVITRAPRPDGNMDEEDILFKPDGTPEVRILGLVKFNHPGEGRYTYSFKDNPESKAEYTILKTDYDSYTIECRCTDVSGGSLVEFYVFSRTPTVLTSTQVVIDEVIFAHHFDDHEINIRSCPPELTGSDGLFVELLKLLVGLVGGLLEGLLGG